MTRDAIPCIGSRWVTDPLAGFIEAFRETVDELRHVAQELKVDTGYDREGAASQAHSPAHIKPTTSEPRIA
jgi:hypothetical protein